MQASAPRRVLIADDNEDSVQSFAMLLSFSGHEVRIALDGAQALEVAREFRPEIAFLDVTMPHLSGYEVAAAMRAEPWGEAVRLIAVSGWSGDNEERRAESAGFDLRLVKPVDPEVVERLLREIGPDVCAQ